MKKIFLTLIIFLPCFSFGKVQVATTTTDLAAVVKEVGQDQVEVFSIAKGTQDPHQIEAKPSFMVKLRQSDVVITQGLELESAWITPLIQGSRNPKLLAKDGLLELGADLDPLEIPKGNVSRAEGDVHPGGNPHFQLDPTRLGKAALLIATRLSSIEPAQKTFFTKNAEAFQKKMASKEKDWTARIRKTGVKEVVTYHKTLAYFCSRFELECTVQLEPKPGIPPTTSHLLSVIDQMKKRHIRLVLIENYYEDSAGQKIKTDIANAIIERVPVSVEGDSGTSTNEALIEKLVQTIEKAAH